MPVGIVRYGERGIINTLAESLKLGEVDAVKELLKAVIWANGGQPDWIVSVTKAKLIVEVGLSQFGDPDLIVVCQTHRDMVNVVLLEAKVVRYFISAMSVDNRMRRGFNSSINGQLSLKYRFARALLNWHGPPHTLFEPRDLAKAYQQAPGHGGLGSRSLSPRKLAKLGVLEILHVHGLAGLPLDRFHFVALTWDREPFFNSPNFGASPFRPLFLDEAGLETWNLPQTQAHVGWLGYDAIADWANLAPGFGAEYRQALATMVPDTRPRDLLAPAGEQIPRVKTYCIDKISNQLTKESLFAIQAAAKKRFRDRGVIPATGSTSIKPRDKVLIKFVPQEPGQDEYLLLGIAASLGRQDWGEVHLTDVYRIGQGRNAKPFYTIRLPRNTVEAVRMADAVFETLAEILELNREDNAA
jgi:hypothetical protein